MSAYSIPALMPFITLLAIAAAADVAERTVPNWISVAIAASGIAAQASTGGWRAAASSAAVALALGTLLVVPWSMRLVGGGDLKLASAAAAWMGLGRILPFMLATALAGGVLALPFLKSLAAVGRELLVAASLRRVGAGALPPPRERNVPFAVAIAIGAAAAAAMG
jgi:prepilin peptidase CpaA